ncbi:hypothetical protein J7M23_08710 [Candidatus Sumerlaeota bacterium]|nr:hypothetical protein [Candidatus Sumerlaeota bacterium]
MEGREQHSVTIRIGCGWEYQDVIMVATPLLFSEILIDSVVCNFKSLDSLDKIKINAERVQENQ